MISGCKRWVGDKNVSLNSISHHIGLASRICKWVRWILVHLVFLWRWFYISWWIISFGSQYWNVIAHVSGCWSFFLLTFVFIYHNCKGILKLIWQTHVGFDIQPSICQINIFGCGHSWWVIDEIPPIIWDRICFHIRYCWYIFVKYYMIFGAYSSCGCIPHKCNTDSVEWRVPKVTPIHKFGSHFGGPEPPSLWRRALSAYIGQHSVW